MNQPDDDQRAAGQDIVGADEEVERQHRAHGDGVTPGGRLLQKLEEGKNRDPGKQEGVLLGKITRSYQEPASHHHDGNADQGGKKAVFFLQGDHAQEGGKDPEQGFNQPDSPARIPPDQQSKGIDPHDQRAFGLPVIHVESLAMQDRSAPKHIRAPIPAWWVEEGVGIFEHNQGEDEGKQDHQQDVCSGCRVAFLHVSCFFLV